MKYERKAILDETKTVFFPKVLPHLPKCQFFLVNRPITKFKAQKNIFFWTVETRDQQKSFDTVCRP